MDPGAPPLGVGGPAPLICGDGEGVQKDRHGGTDDRAWGNGAGCFHVVTGSVSWIGDAWIEGVFPMRR